MLVINGNKSLLGHFLPPFLGCSVSPSKEEKEQVGFADSNRLHRAVVIAGCPMRVCLDVKTEIICLLWA